MGWGQGHFEEAREEETMKTVNERGVERRKMTMTGAAHLASRTIGMGMGMEMGRGVGVRALASGPAGRQAEEEDDEKKRRHSCLPQYRLLFRGQGGGLERGCKETSRGAVGLPSCRAAESCSTRGAATSGGAGTSAVCVSCNFYPH